MHFCVTLAFGTLAFKIIIFYLSTSVSVFSLWCMEQLSAADSRCLHELNICWGWSRAEGYHFCHRLKNAMKAQNLKYCTYHGHALHYLSHSKASLQVTASANSQQKPPHSCDMYHLYSKWMRIGNYFCMQLQYAINIHGAGRETYSECYGRPPAAVVHNWCARTLKIHCVQTQRHTRVI